MEAFASMIGAATAFGDADCGGTCLDVDSFGCSGGLTRPIVRVNSRVGELNDGCSPEPVAFTCIAVGTCDEVKGCSALGVGETKRSSEVTLLQKSLSFCRIGMSGSQGGKQ